jgi:7-carboxy-7-deazaguanine synthase
MTSEMEVKAGVKQLPVMERFYTVQGEGAYAGAPAYFIRLGGCDVGCVWCDVKESWPMDAHPLMDVELLVNDVKSSGAKICVVTGGEPAMHDLKELTTGLRSAGIRAHIETSGTHELTGEWDWITFSPKKFKAPVASIYPLADELKVIVNHKSDIPWAVEHAAKTKPDCKLYLQPEWDKRDAMQPLILDFIRQNTQWRISVQTHKYMGVD